MVFILVNKELKERMLVYGLYFLFGVTFYIEGMKETYNGEKFYKFVIPLASLQMIFICQSKPLYYGICT